MTNRTIAWIFHCEFSQFRGPQSALKFKEMTMLHAIQDPLSAERQFRSTEVYILEGGYKDLYRKYKDAEPSCRAKLFDRVDPSYCTMWDENFANEMKSQLRARELSWKMTKPHDHRRPQKKKHTKQMFRRNHA